VREFTPINAFKLSKRGKDVLKECKAILKCNVTKVHVKTSDYSELLASVSPASRIFYQEAIPLDGKIVVRK
jgi:hypothetical protein